MKKIVILLVLILCTGMMTESFAQKDRRLSRGFSINLITGVPLSSYGGNIYENKSGIISGFKIGNRWYFTSSKKFEIGLMANWADISVAFNSTNLPMDYKSNQFFADFSVCEVGPIGTIPLADAIALDAYCNIRPTVLASIYSISPNYSSNETVSYVGGGVSYGLGTAFRWKVLNVGLEYVFGKVKCSDTNTDSGYPDITLKTDNFRILVGVKF